MENEIVQHRYLDEDFLFKEVLPKLPSKSVLRFKSVSRNWLARFTADPTFTADHTRSTATADHEPHHILEHCDLRTTRLFVTAGSTSAVVKLVELDTRYIRDSLGKQSFCEFELVGSGNGLVCLKALFYDDTCDLVVWNPVSKEFKLIQPLGSVDPREEYYFGVAKGSEDYKLVCVWERYGDNGARGMAYADVLSKSKSSWKPLEDCTLALGFRLSCVPGQGLTLDGTMYWAAEYGFNSPLHETDPFGICSCELGTDKAQQVQGPRICHRRYNDFVLFGLFECKGCLAVALIDKRSRWQIFTMKTDSNKTSWSSIFVDTSKFYPYQGVGFLGDQLILSKGSDRYLYDFNTNELTADFEDLGRTLMSYTRYRTFSHIHTLVSPN